MKTKILNLAVIAVLLAAVSGTARAEPAHEPDLGANRLGLQGADSSLGAIIGIFGLLGALGQAGQTPVAKKATHRSAADRSDKGGMSSGEGDGSGGYCGYTKDGAPLYYSGAAR